MQKYIIPLCLWVLSSTSLAVAQVPETPPPTVTTSAQESPQQWEYKTIKNVIHISGNTWEEDGVRIGAQAAGWMNTYGAQGWELIDVVAVSERDAFGNSVFTRFFYFKRPVGVAN